MPMTLLFSPITIKGVKIRNRIVQSPMCQYSAVDGFSSDWHFVHHGSRAIGGAGLIIFEATAVSSEGRISPGDLGIWNDEHIAGLDRIVEFINANGAIAGIQLAHAGRKASHAVPWKGGHQLSVDSGGWDTVAPSAIPFSPQEIAPKELDKIGIEKVINDFKYAARRAIDAGFKVIEIHSAHGYLLNEFLSPLSNQRKDSYGGPFENRIRLLLEVVSAIQSVWPPENPIFVRISCTDWTEGGWTLEETVKLAAILRKIGIDLIDCSSGGNAINAQIPVKAGYQVPFSEAVKKTGILSGAVGLITTAEMAESILKENQADLIFFARELLRNPYFPLQAAKELGISVDWPIQYERAKVK
jgi:2,4-dienoyl-CoA reductase-like NADH-dependent reductase (Old Yellow Enzyme family)